MVNRSISLDMPYRAQKNRMILLSFDALTFLSLLILLASPAHAEVMAIGCKMDSAGSAVLASPCFPGNNCTQAGS
jgi:hypothetical protein